MSRLDEYESEYLSHVSSATKRLEHADRAGSSDERRAATTNGERSMEAAKDILQLMELEGRSIPKPERAALNAKLRGYRASLCDLKIRAKEIRASMTPQPPPSSDTIRAELFSPVVSDDSGERTRMLESNHRLASGTERLQQAHHMTVDMEAKQNKTTVSHLLPPPPHLWPICQPTRLNFRMVHRAILPHEQDRAADILGELGKQRQTLLHSRQTLGLTSEQLGKSQRLLRSMGRRAAANKMVLWVILGLIGALVLFSGWGGGGQLAAAAPAANQGGRRAALKMP